LFTKTENVQRQQTHVTNELDKRPPEKKTAKTKLTLN